MTIFQADATWVDSVSIDDDYSPVALDVKRFERASVSVSWSGYDGVNAAINIQGSNTDESDDWHDIGGNEGALTEITDASGKQMWEIREITYAFMRFRFYLGTGTTATISAGYILK